MARESITSSVNTGTAKRRAATSYGRRLHEREALAQYTPDQGRFVWETTFTYDKLPNFVVGDKLYNYLPKGAQVVSAKIEVLTTFLGGTSLTVGTYDTTTGAAVAATGLVTATEGALANLVAGAFVTGAGALIGAAGLAANYNIKAVAAGTFTQGEATLRIECLVPQDRFAPLNG